MSHSYPSGISREQFARILPTLESARRRTKPRTVDLYDVFCGVLYLLKSGCQWRMLPADFPDWRTCCKYFRQWSERPDPEQDSILEQVLKIGWRGPTKQWTERADQLLHRGLPERQEHGHQANTSRWSRQGVGSGSLRCRYSPGRDAPRQNPAQPPRSRAN